MVGSAHGDGLDLKSIRLGPVADFASIIVCHQDIAFHLLQNTKQFFVVNIPVTVEAPRGLRVRWINKKHRAFIGFVLFNQLKTVTPEEIQFFSKRGNSIASFLSFG